MLLCFYKCVLLNCSVTNLSKHIQSVRHKKGRANYMRITIDISLLFFDIVLQNHARRVSTLTIVFSTTRETRFRIFVLIH
jgi:hypothetical protein